MLSLRSNVAWGCRAAHRQRSVPSFARPPAAAPSPSLGARFGPPADRQHASDVSCSAQASEQEPVWFQGRYGKWTITSEDLVEVWGYRVGITFTALAALYLGAFGLIPADQEALRDAMRPLLDPVLLVGCAGMGASLYLIHIYVAVLKRALQVLWGVGTLSIIGLAVTQDQPVPVFVYEHPLWMLAVGPLLAALTGVSFKEGLCYNKAEAAGLFGAIPLLAGGHLLGVWGEQAEQGLLASVLILLSVFAGRKYTQRVADDIGDKSVFEFLKKSPEEQAAVFAKEDE